MAYLWPSSLVPWLDPCGDPYSGARAFFFNAGTTTPKTTFTDGSLDVPHDHPVVASGSGRFPAVFLTGGDFRVRVETADGVTLADVDHISIPDIGGNGGGSGGDTPVEERFQTGDFKERYDTGPHTGWVRSNGRTIGSALSGATERANDDTLNLFVHLWEKDPDLAVSGGRRASAQSDFSANKTIALPDFRLYARIAPSGMGAAVSTVIPASDFSGGDGDKLGATVGQASVTLTVAQIPAHNHPGRALPAGRHRHGVPGGYNNGNNDFYARSSSGGGGNLNTTEASDHEHTVQTNNIGGGGAHMNIQPSKTLSLYIKL